ncbi:MAG: NAD(+) synthase, partial [Candidatus Omnitrophota bacterium]|nr:NAD(+) synthase [Candidatus Omnitrophota bacterium]
MRNVKIVIAQINTTVGDLKGNKNKILSCLEEAGRRKADLVIFPELTITGYPPEDLLLKPYFIKENIKCIKDITKAVGDIVAVIGFVDEKKGNIYNSAAVLNNKKIIYIYHKRQLPNYGVFDEKRYFKPGYDNKLIKIKDLSFSVNICEDIWVKDKGLRVKGAQFLVNISASPYHIDKTKERERIIGSKAKRFNIPIVYCNLIGGQDELVFDGRSALFWKDGKIIKEAKAFNEDLLVFDLYTVKKEKARPKVGPVSRDEEIYSALVLGVRDYVHKNNFKKAALGLSGGIDSALVACIAEDALGKDNVLAVSMPSGYSSKGTQDDAEKIAGNIGIKFLKVPISNIFSSYLDTLNPHFKGLKPDTAEENIQARIRGNI